jgi:hypothetical protein
MAVGLLEKKPFSLLHLSFDSYAKLSLTLPGSNKSASAPFNYGEIGLIRLDN